MAGDATPVLAVMIVLAAVEGGAVQPGLWESIARTDLSAAPGLDPAAAALLRRAVARPHVTRACVTVAALAADPAAMVAAGPGCRLAVGRRAGARLQVERQCGDSGAMGSTIASLAGSVGATSYLLTGAVGATPGAPAAPAMAMTVAIAGRRIGACPAP